MNNLIVRNYMKKLLYGDTSKKLLESQEEDIDVAFWICSKRCGTIDDFMSFGYSNQRILAVALRMLNVGILTRTIEERQSVFRVNSEFNMKLSKLKELNTLDSSEIVAKRCKESSIIVDIPYDIEKITSEKDKLIQYMKHIVHIETDIYALKQRYDSLVSEWEDAVVCSVGDYTIAEQAVDKMKDDLLETINELKEKINAKPSPDTQYVHLELPCVPVMPEFKEIKPTEPTYKTPGLFNKKRVNEENNELRRRHEDALNQYNQLYQSYLAKEEQYQRNLEIYNTKVEEIKAEEERQNEEAYQAAIKVFEENNAGWISELAKKEEKLAGFDRNKTDEIEKQLISSEPYTRQKRIEQEIQYIVNLLKKCYESQAKLYSYGVIYGKYRTYIAMSSFLDYFLSGRVATLDGPNGAYNLYEQESRTDVIIGKLDVIINSLEKIKENQYYIYNELQSANSMLTLINEQLLFNNVLQVAQLEKLDSIERNTEEIAYNTKVAAFYSKKTAELTDALGFMMAL